MQGMWCVRTPLSRRRYQSPTGSRPRRYDPYNAPLARHGLGSKMGSQRRVGQRPRRSRTWETTLGRWIRPRRSRTHAADTR